MPDAPVADAEAERPSDVAAEPAPRSAPESPAAHFAAGLRADQGALKGRPGRADRSNGSTAPGESAESDGSASKPGASAGEPSRRGAAAKISEQQAEIDRLVAEGMEAKRRADDAEARVKRADDERTARHRAALERIGDDATFSELANRRQRREPMSYEDDERLDAMLAARDMALPFWELAESGHKASIARGVAARADTYGLDKDKAFGLETPDLIDYVNDVAEARVKGQSADRITALEAELKGLRTKVAAYEKGRAPTAGGSSAPPGATPDRDASPSAWFAHGLRQEAARRGRAS